MTKFREKILYFFDNVSKKDYKLHELDPQLYNNFCEITKNYGDQRYFRKIQVIRDIHKYILFRLVDNKKITWVVKYIQKHQIPMSVSTLKYYGFAKNGITSIQELYTRMHGDFPKCSFCNKYLSNVQLFSSVESNLNRFCSRECQNNSRLHKFKKLCSKNSATLVDYGVKDSTLLCNKCGNQFERNTSNISSKQMFTCNDCLQSYSRGQQEIRDYLDSLGIRVELEARNLLPHKSLDLYCPDFGIAIEYDGLMYHSHGVSKHSVFNNPEIEPKKHIQRKQELKQKDITLYRIWDIEWIHRQDLVKSMLSSIFKKTIRIFARKCEIKEVNISDVRKFLSENHIQGYAHSKHKYGLYYENELVSLATFGVTYRSKGKYELIRFCSKKYTTIIGGLSKLIKHFERTHNPLSLISYADLRYSDGNSYNKVGFTLSHNSTPNYKYFKKDYESNPMLYDRSTFSKGKIRALFHENKLEYFNEEENEFLNMFKNGYRVIFDCGSSVFYRGEFKNTQRREQPVLQYETKKCKKIKEPKEPKLKNLVNYRLTKYNPPFFNISKVKNKAYYNRYKHRLIAWYLLHEYSLNHALTHLAKHTDLLRVINNEFKDYTQQIEKDYQIDLKSSNKEYLKFIILEDGKLCKHCNGRILGKGIDFCSIKCSNRYKATQPEYLKKSQMQEKVIYPPKNTNLKHLKA